MSQIHSVTHIPVRSRHSRFWFQCLGAIIYEHRKQCPNSERLFCSYEQRQKALPARVVRRRDQWIIPGEEWPLAGTHRGHGGLETVLQKASEEIEMTYPKPPEIVAQGDRVLVIGVAIGTIKATKKPFKDNWVFDIMIQGATVTRISVSIYRYSGSGKGL